MDTLSEILKKRSPPGVLIFDLNDRLLYSNQEAYVILAARSGKEAEALSIPDEILQLCRQIKEGNITPSDAIQEKTSHYPVLSVGTGLPCSLRALLLGDHGAQGSPTHIMVLMEKVVERHEVDIDKARQEFQLSKREGEVVRFICQGLGNREIGEMMFISEYTVKDHIKNIMRKMKAISRNEIVAFLK